MAVIVYGVVQAKNGDLARVTVSEAEVVIKPRGVFIFLSFRWSIRIPIESIEWASVIKTNDVDPPGMRFGATFFPGLIAGTFLGSDGRSYWLTGQRGTALQIELDDGPLAFVVVQVADPNAVAVRIRSFGRTR